MLKQDQKSRNNKKSKSSQHPPTHTRHQPSHMTSPQKIKPHIQLPPNAHPSHHPLHASPTIHPHTQPPHTQSHSTPPLFTPSLHPPQLTRQQITATNKAANNCSGPAQPLPRHPAPPPPTSHRPGAAQWPAPHPLQTPAPRVSPPGTCTMLALWGVCHAR